MIATPILASGDSVSIDPTAADALTATDGAISAADASSTGAWSNRASLSYA